MREVRCLPVACATALVLIAGNLALADLIWYDGNLSRPDLETFLGGSPAAYGFEDQAVTAGSTNNYVGNGAAPDYGLTWTTNPNLNGNTQGFVPDDLNGYVNHANSGTNWGTGPMVGASGKLLINCNENWGTLVPIGVSFPTGQKGFGSLIGASSSVVVKVYGTSGNLLGSHQYTLPFPDDEAIEAAGYEVIDYHSWGNTALYWGVKSDNPSELLGGFKFDNANYLVMDNMLVQAPEPASLGLLLAGLGGLWFARRAGRGKLAA